MFYSIIGYYIGLSPKVGHFRKNDKMNICQQVVLYIITSVDMPIVNIFCHSITTDGNAKFHV